MVALALFPPFLAKAAGSFLVAGAGAVLVIMWRLREARSAVSLRKIIIPPLGMATGFSMFVDSAFRVPWTWAAIAFLTGAVILAWPLLLTTRLELQGQTVRMKRSSAFLVVILVLAGIRIFARGYFDYDSHDAADGRHLLHPRVRHDRDLAGQDAAGLPPADG